MLPRHPPSASACRPRGPPIRVICGPSAQVFLTTAVSDMKQRMSAPTPHVVRRIRSREERGQTLVEFALVLPLLGLLIFGIIQFGIIFNNYVTLTDAARAGARRAARASRYGA